MKHLCIAGLLLLASGCSALTAKPASPPAFYSLDAAGGDAVTARPRVAAAGTGNAASVVPTLIVNPPQAAAGFDSRRIIYVRELHKLEYFAYNEWVDTPARMLAPLLVAALENSGAFRAVVLTPSAASGELRLDTEIVRLQQEFGAGPSRVRFTLRAYLVEVKSRRVLGSREFDASIPAPSENPYGGVLAANRALQTVLGEVSAFCAEVARTPAVATGS